MSNGKGAVLAFIGSLILSVGLAGAGGYFLLPRLFPGMNGDSFDPSLIPAPPAYVYEEFGTTAQLLDSDTSWLLVPDTDITITVRNNSRIHCVFSTGYIIGASASVGIEHLKFEIVMTVHAVDDRITRLGYWDNSGVSNSIEITGSLHLELTTPPVTNGTYLITVGWHSVADIGGVNYLLFRTPAFNYVRSLFALEILA